MNDIDNIEFFLGDLKASNYNVSFIEGVENLIKENKELKEKNKYLPAWVGRKYISKDKIKEKIEKLDKKKRKSHIEYSTIDEIIFDKKIEVLQELLGENKI